MLQATKLIYAAMSTLWRWLVHAVLKVGRYGMPELSQRPTGHTGLPFNKILNTGRERKGGGTPSWCMLLNEFSSKSQRVLLHKIFFIKIGLFLAEMRRYKYLFFVYFTVVLIGFCIFVRNYMSVIQYDSVCIILACVIQLLSNPIGICDG